jgi:hypothetical protein
LIGRIEASDDISVSVEEGLGLRRGVVTAGIKEEGSDDSERDEEGKAERPHRRGSLYTSAC